MDFIMPKSGRLWKNKADFFRPFRAAASEAGQNIVPLYDPNLPRLEVEASDLRELNFALAVLVDLFPDVQPEVFREMLSSLGEESRLEIVTEHLLQKKAKWVQGRQRTPMRLEPAKLKKRRLANGPPRHGVSLTDEERFRTEEYQKAVKQVLYQEFKSLSHSTIKAVLAEQNFSYTLSRPILQEIWAKSWRISISNLWSKRPVPLNGELHPFVIWSGDISTDAAPTPAVKSTGSRELDHELYELFVATNVAKQERTRVRADQAIASHLNTLDAEAAESMFDCECCYTTVTFEEIATCDDGCHVFCLDCVQRIVKEALYGQGWLGTISLSEATVRCFAPVGTPCQGCIPSSLVRRALTRDVAENEDLWEELQFRISSESLLQSGLRLQRCPFCSYAEADDLPALTLKHPMDTWHHIITSTSNTFPLSLILILAAMPILIIPLLLLCCAAWLATLTIASTRQILDESLRRTYKRRRGLKFKCQDPSCLITSCTRCMAPWQDPHSCFESEATSLRTAIESSATAAIKRTCPKCMLSFVKSSGCNKLVCNCGYTMCYICRKEITSREGYSHFCQHFRPNGGRCSECERCDLYGDEDETAAIREAVKEAEIAWREKEGGKGDDGMATQLMVDTLVGQAGEVSWFEKWVDSIVDALVA